MLPEQARAITMTFPTDLASHEWFVTLGGLLEEIPNCQVSPGKITLSSIQPAGAWPVIELIQAPVVYPQLAFDLDQPFDLDINEFKLADHPVFSDATLQQEAFDSIERVEDNLGFYVRLAHNETDFKELLTLDQFAGRLKGHLVRVDHFGVNLPASEVSRKSWAGLLKKVAAQANLYRYPEGFEWPFIIPATKTEFESDISSFGEGREPRFELVYDEVARFPLYQFALETDLTGQELEALFPAPYGYSIPELADLFRSVYIFHPWPGLGVRFDLYFKDTGETTSDWETGEWLVRKGGRIRP